MLSFNDYDMCKSEVIFPLRILLTDDEVRYIAKIYKENLN